MPPSSLAAAAAKYQCSECRNSYSRSAHLRRHQATHAGQLASSCPFCNRCFARSDVARRHTKTCARKENQPVPPEKRRGKTRQACDNCARSKIACDRAFKCANCRKHALNCSYARLDNAVPTSAPAALPSASPELTENGPAPGKIPVSFLVSFTDPGVEGSSELLAAQSMSENHNSHNAISYTSLQNYLDSGYEEPSFDAFSCGDSDLLPGIFPHLLSGDAGYTIAEHEPTDSPVLTTLHSRGEELVDLLASLHAALEREDPENAPFFDLGLARSVFTGKNIYDFIWAFFDRLHRHIPILHRPSFDPQTVALPLFLAVVVVGSAFTAPVDAAISTRQFLWLAEEFVFRAPQFQRLAQGSPTEKEDPKDLLEHVQAALLIVGSQLSMNNRRTRRRVRTQRHPSLVAAARVLFVAKSKSKRSHHSPLASEWNEFISSEMCIRLAAITFLTDAQLTVHFNSPPAISISELTCRLPCRDDLFEAETLEAFHHLRQSTDADSLQSPYSLAEFMVLLMQDRWPGPFDPTLRSTTIRHLMMAVGALNTTIHTLRAASLLAFNQPRLSRALARWKSLWEGVVAHTPPQELSGVGFMRHADEFWWFATGVMRICADGRENRYRFLADMTPRDDLEDCNGLVRGLKDGG
ncbi:nadh-ubiquinone oxidoreductase kda mitochondrial [Neofusicoccum parvum]|nr:nadh-ubiquinone oxidoreductase kda mitochondrial [Neofusicoccum parvum]